MNTRILLPVFLILLLCNGIIYSQDRVDKAKENLQFLVKDESLKKQVAISDECIKIFEHPGSTKPEFTLWWSEVPLFLSHFHHYSYYDMVDFYNRKGNKRIQLEEYNVETYEAPTQWLGLKVAIDPGHFAGNWEEALIEKKYIKLEADRMGTSKDIEFYEADITWETYELLKKEIEKRGGQVFVSHEKGKPALGIAFPEWYEKYYKEDLENLYESGDVSKELFDYLHTTDNRYEALTYVYKYMDFVGRSRRINKFRPDLTLVIHYNANEYSSRYSHRYWEPTQLNYSMAFVPGAFLGNELKKQDARIEFLRLLVSPNLKESQRLAGHIMKEHENRLKVPNFTETYESETLGKTSISTPYPGVYSRNLYLTRAIESPVAYVESLYQDNYDEARLLAVDDFTVGEIRTSHRIKEVVDAYIAGIDSWLQENRKLNNNDR